MKDSINELLKTDRPTDRHPFCSISLENSDDTKLKY